MSSRPGRVFILPSKTHKNLSLPNFAVDTIWQAVFMMHGGEAIEAWLENIAAHRLNSFATAFFLEKLLKWQQGALGASFERWLSQSEGQEAQRRARAALKRMIHRQLFAAWLRWWESFQETLSDRFAMQDAAKKWLLGALYRAHAKWREVYITTAGQRTKELLALALKRLRHIWIGRAWRTWIEVHEDQGEQRHALQQALQIFMLQTLGKAYRRWIKVHEDQGEQRHALQQALHIFMLQTLARGWRSWRDVAADAKWISAAGSRAVGRWRCRFLRVGWLKWHGDWLEYRDMITAQREHFESMTPTQKEVLACSPPPIHSIWANHREFHAAHRHFLRISRRKRGRDI